MVLQDMSTSWVWEDTGPAGIVSLQPDVTAARLSAEFSVGGYHMLLTLSTPKARVLGGIRSPWVEMQVFPKENLLLKDLSSVMHGSQGRQWMDFF